MAADVHIERNDINHYVAPNDQNVFDSHLE